MQAKSQITNPKSQTNHKSSRPAQESLAGSRWRTPREAAGQITKLQTKKFWLLEFWLLYIICNLCIVICNLNAYAADKIVAIVNNDVITQKDLNDFINFTRMQLSRQYNDNDVEKRLESMKVDLLDRLIEDRLMLQEAKKNKIKIDENMVKARINDIKKRYNSDTEFQADLSRQGLVQADIETKIREQALIYNIIELEVKDKILIRPDEVTDFYNRNIKEFVWQEERELEAITLENEDLANSFAFELKSGQKLVDLAARYPLTINKLKVTNKEELRKDIQEVIFKLNIGGVSDPIRIGDKYYVFKLDNILSPRQQPLSEAQDTISAILFENKMREGLTKWLDKLKKQSYIKIMQE